MTDPGQLTIVVGAGVSIDTPSDIPAGGAVMEVLSEWLIRSAPKLRPTLKQMMEPASLQEPYRGPFGSLRFELLIGECARWQPSLMRALSTLQSSGGPNEWHFTLANLAAQGARLVTTNFDTRIEDAAVLLGRPLKVAVVGQRVPPKTALAEAELIKLHGSFPRARQRIQPTGTVSQIAAFGLGYGRAPSLRDRIRELIDRRDLLIVGYSGSDTYDVVPLLTERSGSAARVFLHKWSAAPAAIFRPAEEFDPTVDEDRSVGPIDVFAGDLSKNHADVWIIEGPTRAFFEAATSTPASTYPPVSSPPQPDANLRALRAGLSAPSMTLPTGTAALVIDSFLDVYRRGEPIRDQAEPPGWTGLLDTQLRARVLIGATVIDKKRPNPNAATTDFADLARRVVEWHRAGSPVYELYAGRDAARDVEHVFWRSIGHGGRDSFAVLDVFNRLCREARLLDELIRAAFLEASALAPPPVGGVRVEDRDLSRARSLLIECGGLAARLPRAELVVECARLLGVTDRNYRPIASRVLAVWGPRLEQGPQRQLAALDRLWWVLADSSPTEGLTGALRAELATELLGRAAPFPGRTGLSFEEAISKLGLALEAGPLTTAAVQRVRDATPNTTSDAIAARLRYVTNRLSVSAG